MNEWDDTYYIKKTLDGETDYFGRLVNRYSHPIFILILKIVRSREDAEELTQDVFLKTFRVLSTFKGDCRFSTWLYRIAYNMAISATRKKKTEFLYIEDRTINNIGEREVEEALNDTENAEQVAKLEQALELLPAEERGLISLFYTESQSIEDIAQVTGMSSSNVKVKLHRIRKKLYVLLTQMEEIAENSDNQ